MKFLVGLITICLLIVKTFAFVVPHASNLVGKHRSCAAAPTFHPHSTMAIRAPLTTTTTRLYNSYDGSGRGSVILGVVFAACVWIFSIPTEFRRAHICSADVCVENRASCYNCVTGQEWMAGVKDYYQKGGGVSFDFSVADETKAVWAGKR
jgi:hypothetical protein